MITQTITPQNTSSDPLAVLKDIDTTQALDLGIAWGWYIVWIITFILLIIIVFFIRKIIEKHHQKRYFNQQVTLLKHSDNALIEASLLLRKFAVCHFDDKAIKSLSDEKWIDFLHQKKPLNEPLKHQLQIAAYQRIKISGNSQEAQALIAYVKEFMRV